MTRPICEPMTPDAMNARLDLEAVADRRQILFSDRPARDLELTFGGRVNDGHSKLAERKPSMTR